MNNLLICSYQIPETSIIILLNIITINQIYAQHLVRTLLQLIKKWNKEQSAKKSSLKVRSWSHLQSQKMRLDKNNGRSKHHVDTLLKIENRKWTLDWRIEEIFEFEVCAIQNSNRACRHKNYNLELYLLFQNCTAFDNITSHTYHPPTFKYVIFIISANGILYFLH